MLQSKRSASTPACHCSPRPLGFTLILRMDSSPSPLLSTFLPTAWLGSYHRARLIESYAFHLQCMFLYCANYKRLTFPFSLPSCLLPSLSRRRCGRKGECGFNQRAGQPPPLMIHSTSRAESEERAREGRAGETECSVISAAVRAKKKRKKKKPRQYDSRQRGLSLQAAGEAAVSQWGREETSG